MFNIQYYRENYSIEFHPLEAFHADRGFIPNSSGIYVVVRDSDDPPAFVSPSPAGWFKDKNPNIPVPELESKWVPDAQTIYVGQSVSLHKRIGDLVRFGSGKRAPHWGGRAMWQLKDIWQCLIGWKVISDRAPRKEEKILLSDFEREYGALPFANRQR